MPMSLVIIAHNIRSTHNVGSLLRAGDGLGITGIYFTGYTPYPHYTGDTRLPHLAEKLTKQINKTALGAEASVFWDYNEDLGIVLGNLRNDGYVIAGLEQTASSISLPDFRPPPKLALLLGSEVTGIDNEILNSLDYCLEIPMLGAKESFNVTCAATIAMYHCLASNQ
jgi:tRNA G18 (ribose-2'-O)-methylase SpoU